jgi:hypothetical protein
MGIDRQRRARPAKTPFAKTASGAYLIMLQQAAVKVTAIRSRHVPRSRLPNPAFRTVLAGGCILYRLRATP